MVLKSLKESFRVLTHNPFFWLIGLLAGIAASVGMYVVMTGYAYYYEVVMVLELVALPFLIAGAFGTLAEGDCSFIDSGKKYYFRVLLPTAVVVFVTLILGMMMSVVAMASAALSTIFFVVIFVFLLLTYFYDTAAVFDECRVYESLKRSAEFVLSAFSKVILFAFVNLAVIIFVGLVMVIVWGVILMPIFEPMVNLPPEEIEAMFSTPEQLISLLGDFGILVSSVIYGLFMLIITSFMYAYKACFYRNRIPVVPVKEEKMQGEYDEKGRWYKY